MKPLASDKLQSVFDCSSNSFRSEESSTRPTEDLSTDASVSTNVSDNQSIAITSSINAIALISDKDHKKELSQQN